MHGRHGLVAMLIVAGSAGLGGCAGKTSNSLAQTELPLAQRGTLANGATAKALPAGAGAFHRAHRETTDWSTAVYSNPEYGISFRYPRDYALEEGEIEERSFFLRRQDDLEPDMKLLATVVIPEDGYPNTTFEHGSLQVLVHEELDREGCRNIVDPEGGASPARRVRMINADDGAFWWSEEKSSADGTQIVEREYTSFLGGRCYEFYAVVAVGEAPGEEGAERQADAGKILRQLEKILLSVRVSEEPGDGENVSRAANEPRF